MTRKLLSFVLLIGASGFAGRAYFLVQDVSSDEVELFKWDSEVQLSFSKAQQVLEKDRSTTGIIVKIPNFTPRKAENPLMFPESFPENLKSVFSADRFEFGSDTAFTFANYAENMMSEPFYMNLEERIRMIELLRRVPKAEQARFKNFLLRVAEIPWEQEHESEWLRLQVSALLTLKTFYEDLGEKNKFWKVYANNLAFDVKENVDLMEALRKSFFD